MPEKVLIIEDDENMRFFLQEAVTKRGYEVETANDAESGAAKFKERAFDLVMMDVKLPGMSGIEAIPLLKQHDPGAVILVMTAFGTKQLAVDALRAGAYDFFTKPFKIEEMNIVISRALEKRHLQRDIKKLEEKLRRQYSFDRIVGNSAPMQQVRQIASMLMTKAPRERTNRIR